MPIEDLNYSSLAEIRKKVRTLTSSPSVNQLTDAKIDHYINTFVLYSFPEDIKLFNLKKTITFYTKPNIDTYETNLTDPNEPLYNFKNRYSFTGEPAYINGVRCLFTQDRSQFFRLYPFVNYAQTIGYGDSINTTFSGTLQNIPVLRGNVTLSSVDNNGDALQVWDDGEGVLNGDVTSPGTIDYVTGAYNFTFTLAPGAAEEVKSKTVPYNPSLPLVLLFFDAKFMLRPIPDDVYAVNLEVYARPSELLDATDMPELSQHWEYIAYGASKKIFEDRRDPESKAEIMDAFKELEEQVRTKSTMQLSEQRASTIYSDKKYFGYLNFPWRY
jgi:hypothetical protein